MNRKHRWLFVLFSVLVVGVFSAACASGQHPAADTVETFLQAMADKNEAQYVTLTCPDYELDALLEYDSFSLVQTRLEGLSCQVENASDEAAEVSCQGEIVATYGNEDRNFELSERDYQVVNQDGAWLVCGY